jgi:hypothetical protein
MMIYHIFAALGFFVVIGVIVKGFWAADSVKPKEQPDSWPNLGGPDGNQ